MSINDSQEIPNTAAAGNSRHRFYPSVILPQMQIERLKREEDDEHWISGEELYTEGSSDDEDQGDEKLIIKSDSHYPGAASDREIRNAENISSNFMVNDNNQQLSAANTSSALLGPIFCNRNSKLNHNIENPAVTVAHPRSFEMIKENINKCDHNIVDEIEKVKIDESAADSSYSCGSVSLEDGENLSASNSSEENYAVNIKTLKQTTTAAAAVMQNSAMDYNHKIAINDDENREENSSITDDAVGDSDEKMEKEISWRPKRGSILLPKLDKS